MSFEHIRAAALRQAIIDTTNAIRGDFVRVTPEPLRSEFQVHLKELLAAERSILAADIAAPTADKPWFPDDSGEWVEVPDDLMGIPPGLASDTMVQVLVLLERKKQYHDPEADEAGNYLWYGPPSDDYRIVAYKKVKV